MREEGRCSVLDGRLVIVEQEAAVVVEILNQRAGGETLQNIADYLDKKGISGKLGGKWNPSTVSYLITRQAAQMQPRPVRDVAPAANCYAARPPNQITFSGDPESQLVALAPLTVRLVPKGLLLPSSAN